MCAIIMCASFIIMFILVERSDPQGRRFTTFRDYCCYFFLNIMDTYLGDVRYVEHGLSARA